MAWFKTTPSGVGVSLGARLKSRVFREAKASPTPDLNHVKSMFL